jgi:SRSO17 transposase
MRAEEAKKKMTKRIEVAGAPAPLEEYAKHFDALFGKSNQREGFRRYMEGLLLPSERHKTLTGLVNTEPVKGAQLPRAQALQWFLSEADWDERKMQECRLQLLREDPTTAPMSKGVLVIDETGDRKDGHKTAHVGRQYLGKLGKVDNGVVSVTSLWADEGVYYPIDVEPYTPAHHFVQGEDDPAFRTKLKIALELVHQAYTQGIPFRAVVADNFYGEDRTLRTGFRALKLGYVLALKPSHDWWHRVGTPGSLREVAQAAGWKSAEQPGQWVKVERKFRDGSQQRWWALEVQAGPYGSEKTERAVIATTDPETLPDATTWHLVTNIPVPDSAAAQRSELEAASLQDIVRLYGLRMWIEQSYKHVKHALGWSQYQVRSDQAIRRHWQLVCCAFSFCWYHASHPCSSAMEDAGEASESPTSQEPQVAVDVPATREKNQQRNRISSTPVLARGAAGRARVVGALDHAAALLASVGRHAPTASAPALA